MHGETIRNTPRIQKGNWDESGCFWRALPDHGLKECEGGEKSKHRLTVAFIASAAGKKERPVGIWKSEKPHCFKWIDKSLLPVDYHHQKKAWMTGDILESILKQQPIEKY